MNLVRTTVSLFLILLTTAGVHAQSTAFGVDGSTFPIPNFVSVALPSGSPITVIAPTVGGQGGDFGPGGVFYSTLAQNLVTFNLETGQTDVLGTITGVDPAHLPIIGMAYEHSTGTMYVTGHKSAPFDSELYTLDLNTAEATLIGTITNSNFVGTIAVNCAGELYGIDLENDNLMRINKETAEGTIIGPLNFDAGFFAQDADFDPSDGTLYWTPFNGTSGELRTIDLASGNSTQRNDWSADMAVFSIAGECKATSVGQSSNGGPANFRLLQNYPNPFNPSTTISFDLDTASEVNLSVYNVKGQLVATLIDGLLPAGSHSFIWSGSDLERNQVPTGLYIGRLTDGKRIAQTKMLLVK